ncbi:MAG: BREX-1 system phosphatase PglZ type B, partial [Chloroflexota bacterium]|nr:BREX-1 system phosphatase PglZ type B [Chloroflexota bacterium]
AVAEAPPADADAVLHAVDALCRSWLAEQAERFQLLALAPGSDLAAFAEPPPEGGLGTCMLFCDGLRMDLGHLLAERLREGGIEVAVGHRLGALPTVTPTAKPAVAPVAHLLGGNGGFDAAVAASGKKVTAPVLHDLLRQAGYQVLVGHELGDPSGMAWAEYGEIDRYGHNHGWKLAAHARDEVRRICQRVEALLGQGWREVVVVTDHGWLLLPGDLPTASLPIHLAEPRKGRCARLALGATPELPVVPWRWDTSVRVALAPGIRRFEAGADYEHGGLSPQEAVIPVVRVRPAGAGSATDGQVGIERLGWRGLKLSVGLSGATPDLLVDLRLRAGDPSSSIADKPKAPDPDGTAAVFVHADKDHLEGQEAVLVVCGTNGTVLAQRTVVVGGGDA